jgi:hypothetical protein
MRDEFLITRQGKQYVLFAGLLDEAHSRGLRGIDTELVQVPDDANGNVAIVKATCEMEDGRHFSGIGDASPENVGRDIAPHLIRMAETRAKARALRDAVNVGATALEELSDGDDAPPAPDGFGRGQSRGRSAAGGATPIRGGQASSRGEGASDAGSAGPARAAEDNGQAESPAAPEKPAAPSGSRRGSAGSAKARKSQVDLLRTLAVEWRGENGVERLENRIGKPLADLTRAEADEWIDRLTPEGRE